MTGKFALMIREKSQIFKDLIEILGDGKQEYFLCGLKLTFYLVLTFETGERGF